MTKMGSCGGSMSKCKILAEEEFFKFAPDPRLLQFIEEYRATNQLKREEVNILDWGCGRGRHVLWLREKGYNAYGVDVDETPINNGLGLFKAKGHDHGALKVIPSDGKIEFPDGYFNCTFSSQVFEHIRNIESVAAEIGRTTRSGGIGYHVYPSHKRITEGHLFMPLVHWLPKNRIRKYVIAIYVVFGIEPKWPGLKESRLKDKVKTYYQYSLDKTFYRRYQSVKRIFEANGFRVSFQTINRPKIRNHRYIGKIIDYRLPGFFINYLLLNFTSVELFIEK